MEELHHHTDPVRILIAPEEYTEEELRQFLADKDNREALQLLRLAQMGHAREHVKVPDTAEEWQKFLNDHHQKPAGTAQHIRLAAAALLGAAAMLLAVFLISRLSASPAESGLVALEYDDTPQHIVITDADGRTQDLGKTHALSFLKDSITQPLPSTATATATLPSPGKRTLKTPRGMDFKLTLPDGTEVWLNAESTLEFPTAFTSTRNVMLTGEAYFKVARDESRPFTVTTDRMNVRVLGTEFNFRHYATERPQVSLVKGEVELLSTDNASTHIKLRPGQGADIDQQGHIRVHNVDTYAVTQWTEGFFYFQNQTLLSVLQELGRWYNTGVIFQDDKLMKEKIHFSALRRESLQETLDKLNQLLHSNIVYKDNCIFVKGEVTSK